MKNKIKCKIDLLLTASTPDIRKKFRCWNVEPIDVDDELNIEYNNRRRVMNKIRLYRIDMFDDKNGINGWPFDDDDALDVVGGERFDIGAHWVVVVVIEDESCRRLHVDVPHK